MSGCGKIFHLRYWLPPTILFQMILCEKNHRWTSLPTFTLRGGRTEDAYDSSIVHKKLFQDHPSRYAAKFSLNVISSKIRPWGYCTLESLHSVGSILKGSKDRPTLRMKLRKAMTTRRRPATFRSKQSINVVWGPVWLLVYTSANAKHISSWKVLVNWISEQNDR